MGKNNRARRAAKEKQRQRERRQPQPGDVGGRTYRPPSADSARERSAPSSSSPPSSRVLAQQSLHRAIDAFAAGDAATFERTVDALIVLPTDAAGRQVGIAVTLEMLDPHMGRLWAAGWQPVDVVRFVRRELGGAAAQVAIDAIAAHHRSMGAYTVDRRWQTQLDALEARAWWDDETRSRLEQWAEKNAVSPHEALRTTLQVLVVLLRAPRLQVWIPYPGAPASVVARWAVTASAPDVIDRKMLERVRALLAKAESTTFPEEADALTAKAQQLMARHSIDLAYIRTQAGASDVPSARRITVDDPYAGARASLVNAVASANRCRAIHNPNLGFVEVLGFEVDLDIVELLCASLLVQATTAMVGAGRKVDRTGTSRTRSFRQTFLVSFAHHIGQRLQAASVETAHEAVAEHGQALLPVLARRESAVDSLVDEMFPRLRSVRTSATNREGWVAGRVAADQADLGPGEGRRLAET